jgi:hypothetical protein
MAADAVYVRDLVAAPGASPLQLLRLAAVSDALALTDFAFEALVLLHRRHAAASPLFDMRAVLRRAAMAGGLSDTDERLRGLMLSVS